MRELLWLAEGHGRDEWSRWSQLLALTANGLRDPKKHPRPYSAEDFDPYAIRDRRRRRLSGAIELNESTANIMKAAFFEKARKGQT